MRILLPLITAAALVAGIPARADDTAHAPASPLLGAWAVDVDCLPMLPEARPQRVTITFTQPDETHLQTRVEIVDAGGGRIDVQGTTALDGTPAPVTGSPEADVSATTLPQPRVLVMQLARAGLPASTRIYAVSDDGRSMVETAAYYADDGRPILRTHYFSRVE